MKEKGIGVHAGRNRIKAKVMNLYDAYAVESEVKKGLIYVYRDGEFGIIDNKNSIVLPVKILEEVAEIYKEMKELKKFKSEVKS